MSKLRTTIKNICFSNIAHHQKGCVISYNGNNLGGIDIRWILAMIYIVWMVACANSSTAMVEGLV